MHEPHLRHKVSMPPQAREPRRPRRRRLSLFQLMLMLLGAGVVIVALGRYVVVPVLVYLPQWIGGTV